MSITAKRIAQYRESPAEWVLDTPMRTAQGKQLLRDVAVPFQLKVIATLAPGFLALAKGLVPPIRFHWIEGIKGCAKTTIVSSFLDWLLIFTRRKGIRAQVGAHDQGQATEARFRTEENIHGRGQWVSKRLVIGKKEIYCPSTNSICEILTTDKWGTGGGNPDVVFWDEAVETTDEAYVEKLLGNAYKRSDALVCIGTNAGWQNTFQFSMRQNALADPLWSFNQCTERMPQTTEAVMASVRRTLSDSYVARYYDGMWSPGTGDHIDQAKVTAALTQRGPMDRPPQGEVWAFRASVDLGVSHDHSAVVVMGTKQGSDRMVLAQCKSFKPTTNRKVNLDEVEQYIFEMHRKFNFRALHYDQYQAEQMVGRFERAGINCIQAKLSSGTFQTEMAMTLIESLNLEKLDLFPDEDLLHDFRRITLQETPWAIKLVSAKDAHGHADRIIAMAQMLPALAQQCHYGAYGERQPPQRLSTSPNQWDNFRRGVQLGSANHRPFLLEEV